MTKRSEGFFAGYGNERLFYQVWEPEHESKGLVVITHGQAEHSECYHRLVEALRPLNLTVLAWDMRGHGRSSGQRGYVEFFEDYSRDYEILLQTVIPQYAAQKKTFYFAHSMGALVQLSTLVDRPQGTEAIQILSSPFLALALEVPAIKDAAARVMSRLLPRLTLSNEIVYENLSRDPEVIQEFKKDTLRHGKISSEAYLGALRTGQGVLERASRWRGPLLMMVSDHDPIVSTETNLKFFDSLETRKKQLEVFEGFKHELVNDLGREEVFEKLKTFLAEQL